MECPGGRYLSTCPVFVPTKNLKSIAYSVIWQKIVTFCIPKHILRTEFCLHNMNCVASFMSFYGTATHICEKSIIFSNLLLNSWLINWKIDNCFDCTPILTWTKHNEGNIFFLCRKLIHLIWFVGDKYHQMNLRQSILIKIMRRIGNAIWFLSMIFLSFEYLKN